MSFVIASRGISFHVDIVPRGRTVIILALYLPGLSLLPSVPCTQCAIGDVLGRWYRTLQRAKRRACSSSMMRERPVLETVSLADPQMKAEAGDGRVSERRLHFP